MLLALREALANCLVNADFYIGRGVVIRKIDHSIVMENPGTIRTGKAQMLKGGISDPRTVAYARCGKSQRTRKHIRVTKGKHQFGRRICQIRI